MSLRPKDREHLVAFHAGSHLNFADVCQILFQLLQNARTQFPVRHFAAAEPDGGLYFVAFSQPFARVLHTVAVIVFVSARPELNFFDGDYDLFLLGFVCLLLRQVLKLPIVDDLAHRRIGVRRDFNQVHAFLTRGANSVTRIHDPELLAIFGNHANLGHANTFVNADNRRTAKTGTTAASKTCSYCCTSSVSGTDFSLWLWFKTRLYRFGNTQTEVCATNYVLVRERVSTSLRAISLNSDSDIAPMSPFNLSRTATLPSSASRSPSTSMKGIFCIWASRILAPILSPRTFSSTRRPAARKSWPIWPAYSLIRSVIGNTATCTGASHIGNA